MYKRKSKIGTISVIFTLIVFAIIIISSVSSCSSDTVTTVQSAEDGDDKVSLTYVADFYNNFGSRWLSVEGKTFSIEPNKIKTYYYNTDGEWTYKYEMSAMMSIKIDGHPIESCGSTIVFADSRLEKCDIDFNPVVNTEESGNVDNTSSITSPSDLRFEDWYKIQYWWYGHKNLNNDTSGSKIVVVQSQLGNSICMYIGKDVSWDIPSNLPKTTMVTIDGKVLYIHRSNVSIIDTELIKGE